MPSRRFSISSNNTPESISPSISIVQLRRRIARRMILLQRETLEDYVKSLRSDANEVEQLFNDDSHQCYQLLSGSGVLRDSPKENSAKDHQSESGARRFSNLGAGLFNRRGGLFGCDCRLRGTVQQPEQYSRADLRHRCERKDRRQGPRREFIPESIAKGVTSARLRRFFARTANGDYQISRSIRDMCTFARQNVCQDPPFSRIDLITCRNVLIYLGPQLQRKCIPVFHYALNPDGYLMLGTSESVGGYADLFALVDKKHKIYVKKATALRPGSRLCAPRK